MGIHSTLRVREKIARQIVTRFVMSCSADELSGIMSIALDKHLYNCTVVSDNDTDHDDETAITVMDNDTFYGELGDYDRG